ncbi:DUF3093 domain-containing protein [Nocardioides sp. R-C-SC26]|uniref:DUF3093 domain-containing protein n=1 Tax=Nocardioides sp. R-C-SC26 TaxID=2870414 RepID=UPI001E549D9D|nr:DUF3093 domain-containing protein [Nocardioides sp. R-C-SC26]
MSQPATRYAERLGVPLRWWVQGVMLIASLWLALIVAVPAPLAWSVTVITLGLLSLGLVSFGSLRIVVDDELRVGRAHIAPAHLGAITPLDAAQTRRTAGVEADARAYLAMRPYLKRAVRVTIADPGDPAPYWLISTRHPERLAAALSDLVASAR